MVAFIKQNILIFALILILALYLGIKATDNNNWDGWGFGSAQTLMSSRYWAEDGLVKNYFLFIPSSYSKLIKYLDEPEWRARPEDNARGALIRQRIYYTHYPAGYLSPYALLAKLGSENPFYFRILSLIISLAALFLFYLFIKIITGNKYVALIAATYYGLSFTFISFAYSISTQPLTIFFLFLTLIFSVKKYNIGIWLSFFTLSLSSYDATFFVFAWLVGFDIVVLRKYSLKKWLFFALAPIMAFSLQVIQNAWYLGWSDAWRDIYVSYTGRALGSPKNFLIALVTPLVSMTGIKTFYFFKKTIVVLGITIVIIGTLWKLRSKLNLNPNFFRIIFVLAGAVLAQPFFINVTGLWPYQGVLAAPFWGLIVGLGSIFIFDALRKKGEFFVKEKIFFAILILAISELWFFQFYNTWISLETWPYKPSNQIIKFSEEIKKLHPNQEKFAFRILPKNPMWKSQFPTFNMEYYMGMSTFDFTNRKDLLTDFWWLRNRSEYPFYSFIISENKSDVSKIRQELMTKNLKNISPITEIQGQYLFIVGPK